MAIEGIQKTLVITPQTRTRIIEIFIPFGSVPLLRAHREVVNRDAEDNVVSKDNAQEINRGYVAVIDESFVCADGTVISIPHISEALAGMIDRWSIEDEAARVEAARVEAAVVE